MRSRKKKHLLFYIFVLNVLMYTNGISQNVQLSTNTDSVAIGDIFNLNINVQSDDVLQDVIYPDSSAFPQELLWIKQERFKLKDGADSISYTVQNFANQDLVIPSFPTILISLQDTAMVTSNTLTIPFKSVLPSNDADLKPIKPILEFRVFPFLIVLFVLLLFLALAWGYYTYIHKKPSKVPIATPKMVAYKNPLIKLEADINKLKTEYSIADTRNFKFFYSTISDSIREYYETLYQIPALESTTREVLRFLDAFGVDNEMVNRTRTILNKSDKVKFAKFEPTLDDAWKCYADALEFIKRATLIDSSRITRKKIEYEQQWQQSIESNDNAENKTNVTSEHT